MKLINHRPKIAIDLLKWCAWATVLSLTACQPKAPEVTSLSPSPDVSPSTEKTAPGEKLIDSFENQGRANSLGGFWYTDKDKVPGGGSQISPSPGKFNVSIGGADGSGHSAKITGKVTKDGYISLGTSLDKAGQPVDLSQYKGIEFWVKGDGKEYGFQLHTPLAIKDYNYYNFVFVAKPEWTRQVIRFDEMKQPTGTKNVAVPIEKALKQVNVIRWYTYPYGQSRESVELSIDDVKLIQ